MIIYDLNKFENKNIEIKCKIMSDDLTMEKQNKLIDDKLH